MLRFLSIALVALALGAPAQGGEGIFYHAKLFCPQDGCPLEAIRQEVDKVLVQGPNYVVIQFSRKTNYVAGLKLYKTKESDYIRRPLRVTVQNRDEVQFLNSIGMDIWEVKENYVLGRAMDYVIDKIENAELPYELIATP